MLLAATIAFVLVFPGTSEAAYFVLMMVPLGALALVITRNRGRYAAGRFALSSATCSEEQIAAMVLADLSSSGAPQEDYHKAIEELRQGNLNDAALIVGRELVAKFASQHDSEIFVAFLALVSGRFAEALEIVRRLEFPVPNDPYCRAMKLCLMFDEPHDSTAIETAVDALEDEFVEAGATADLAGRQRLASGAAVLNMLRVHCLAAIDRDFIHESAVTR